MKSSVSLKFYFSFWLIFTICSIPSAQISLSVVKKQADTYFEKADYAAALKLYEQAGVAKSTDKKGRLHMAICQYETRDVKAALNLLQNLMNEGKTEPLVYFYAGRCYEALNFFPEAITVYKRYLQRTKEDDELRPWVKDQLIRCANGARMKYADEITYVENAGSAINTPFREYGVRHSPTTIGKIYFNSDRKSTPYSFSTTHPTWIYSSTLTNGRWTEPVPISHHVNAGGFQEVLGFSSTGQILYFNSVAGNQNEIRTDTFTTEADRKYQGNMRAPFVSPQSAADLTFFNDTICLYASDQAGGFGGYDLYISLFTHGHWSTGINLGPMINTHYDERSPFLTRNGLTLFYASNHLGSIGGLDIFRTTFDPEKKNWAFPENVGFPVNTAANELSLTVSPDGMTAYLTSDRKEGYGREDIYRVFFKQPLQAHQEISELPTFLQFIQSRESQAAAIPGPVSSIEVKEYFISHLFFPENGEVLNQQNVKKLDVVVNLMMIYPKITVELSCFDLPDRQRTFSVYFSIKKAEEAAAYMVKKGIDRKRILLKGYGSSFPLASLPAGMTDHPLYQRLNQRMEITLHHYKSEPVIIHMENIQVPENMKMDPGKKFTSLRHGFYYSLQLDSVHQILQNSVLESLDELFIEAHHPSGYYLYMSGFFTTFEEASEKWKNIIEDDFPNARIVPYINGIRLKQPEIEKHAETYPDLRDFLHSQRQ